MSGLHFWLQVLLVVFLTPFDFGVFSLALAVALYLCGICDALIATPHSVFYQRAPTELERSALEASTFSLQLRAMMLVLLVGLGAALLSDRSAATLALVAFVVSFAMRSYARQVLFARSDAGGARICDISYASLGGLGVAAYLGLFHASATIAPVLAILALAGAVASLLALARFSRAIMPVPIGVAWLQYRPLWEQARWGLLGAAATGLQFHAIAFALSALRGPEALGPIAAAAVPYGPVRVVIQSLMLVFRREQARRVASHDHAGAALQVRRFSLLLVAVSSVYALVLWIAWPWLATEFLPPEYDRDTIWLALLFWGTAQVVIAAGSPFGATILAMARFKALAVVSVMAAATAVIAVFVFALTLPAEATVLGVLAGASLSLVGMVVIVRGGLR